MNGRVSMKLMTEILGEIEYNENEVIVFSEGLYGFGENKKFIIINIAEVDLPFQWLQSVEDGSLSFVMTTPFAFYDPYEFEISDTIVEQLEIASPDDLVVYSLAVLSDTLENSTLNLKAPLLINIRNKMAKQVILNEDYPYKYPFFKNTRQEG